MALNNFHIPYRTDDGWTVAKAVDGKLRPLTRAFFVSDGGDDGRRMAEQEAAYQDQLEQWWQDNGEAVLAGKPVPDQPARPIKATPA